MWRSLIRCFWELARFKKPPGILPYSFFLLFLVSFLYFILMVCQWGLVNEENKFSGFQIFFAGLSLLGVYYLYSFILLRFNNKIHRWVQTVIALIGSHFIIHVFALPLVFIAPFIQTILQNRSLTFLVGFIYLIITISLTIWQFLITGFIYKHALEIDNLPSLLASFGLLAFNILTVSLWQ